MSYEVIDYLIKLGHKVAGSINEKNAGDYLYKKFSEIINNTKIQSYDFLGWFLKGKNKIKILSPHIKKDIDFNVFMYSKPIEQKVIGNIEKFGILKQDTNGTDKQSGMPKFILKSDRGLEIANIYANTNINCKKAVPLANPYNSNIFFNIPSIVIGLEDYNFILGLLNKNKIVKISFHYEAEYNYNSKTKNIISKIKGNSNKSIVIGAHYDSAFGTPGAIDNCSGVQCLYNLAKYFSEKKLKKTFIFIALSAEESGHLGSKYYINRLKEQDFLKNIDCFICIDGIEETKKLLILANPFNLAKDMYNEILKFKLSKFFKKENIIPMLPLNLSDSWEFYLEGIPTIFLEHTPSMVWHLPQDNTYKKRDIDLWTEFYIYYINRLDNSLIL